jgi:hypothetical protein
MSHANKASTSNSLSLNYTHVARHVAGRVGIGNARRMGHMRLISAAAALFPSGHTAHGLAMGMRLWTLHRSRVASLDHEIEPTPVIFGCIPPCSHEPVPARGFGTASNQQVGFVHGHAVVDNVVHEFGALAIYPLNS